MERLGRLQRWSDFAMERLKRFQRKGRKISVKISLICVIRVLFWSERWGDFAMGRLCDRANEATSAMERLCDRAKRAKNICENQFNPCHTVYPQEVGKCVIRVLMWIERTKRLQRWSGEEMGRLKRLSFGDGCLTFGRQKERMIE